MSSRNQDLAPALEMVGVTKRFPGTLAVDGVDFDVRPGEVHALMGENGAGKSTLMKVMAGAYGDYSGHIRIRGEEITLSSPAAARHLGIGMVYQELSLAPPISIAENLLAGRLPTKRGGWLDLTALFEEARRCLARVGLTGLDPQLTVEEISQHEAQLVEIAKVLGNEPHILVLDEPTSALSREEVQRLFGIVRELKGRGLAIVYISHHLAEVFEIADRVTVLRDGKRVATRSMGEVTPESLVEMMVGQSMGEFYHAREVRAGETLLKVQGLTRYGFFHDVSFDLRQGEILGVIGLAGSGRSELARSLCGLDPVHAGRAELDDEPLPLGSYPRTVQRGLVYLSEDRKNDGLFLNLSLIQNTVAALLPRHTRAGVYFSGSDRQQTLEIMELLQIVASSPDADAASLSGGNQQKVLLGKWLSVQPRVLILDEPSRGVDVKAKAKIHDVVRALADQGAAIMLISSDLAELVSLSDRALVLRDGHALGEVRKQDLNEQSALLAANGQGAITRA